ncbi:MAG: kynureninase [Planctomycetota bacterium]|nr:MAG: kynureninase [Planctomycetota bacterium]
MNYQDTEEFARGLDALDALAPFRERFHVPLDTVYFCGNSLGLQPKAARLMIAEELDDWQNLAVAAHLEGRRPWYSYHEIFADSAARIVGATPGEVVMMNSLTVNIHLMLVSFFRPDGARNKVLMEHPAFPSDIYAVRTHLRSRGLDPDESIVRVAPRDGEHVIRTEDIEGVLDEHGSRIALVWLPGVNFMTGQVFDMARITTAAKRQGCTVGFDLAHAAGNVPMRLHDWGVDFACWCTYKYLNAGPGSVGGCFVHESHGRNPDLQRYAGWWGDDPETRFQMHLKNRFIPQPGAAGWQVSNPPILSMTALKASLDIFDEAGFDRLREKSKLLTGYLRWLLEQNGCEIITPADPDAQGCQLSILVGDEPERRHQALVAQGIVCDFRPPNVIRAAPTPLYNTFGEVRRFSKALQGG